MKENIIVCPVCSSEFNEFSKHGNSKKYCSRSCSNTAIHKGRKKKFSIEGLNNIRKANNNKETIKRRVITVNRNALERFNRLKKRCTNCDSLLSFERRHNKTCSTKCAEERNSKNGDYKEGCTWRSKHGRYDNIYFDSTWELAFYLWQSSKGISISRCTERIPYIKDGVQSYHIPDFKIDNEYHEIKGRSNKYTLLKEKMMVSKGFNYKIWYEQDLKQCFSYIRNRFRISAMEDLAFLYSDRNYKNTCPICSKIFYTQSKTCSRKCGAISMVETRSKNKIN